MRIKALSSDISLKKSTLHKLCLGESRSSALVMIQEGETVRYLRISTPKYLGFEETALKTAKMMPLKARD